MPRLRLLAGAIAACLPLAMADAAPLLPVTAPSSAFDSQFGDSNNCMVHCMPEGQRFQQVYSSALFGDSPFYIRGMAFRFREAPYLLPYARGLQVTLSTTSKLVDGLSATFAENVGADALVVRDGMVNFSAGAGSFAFDQVVLFDQDFLYDPTQGNLLVDVLHGVSPFNFVFHYFDAENDPNDGISRIIGPASQGSVSPLGVDSLGLVTQFFRVEGEILPTKVPEPGALGLLAAGLGLLAGVARRR